jgi:hypothetical protein
MVGVASIGTAVADPMDSTGVTVNADFIKDKDTYITENIYKEKAVFLQATVAPEVTKMSESLAMLNQATSGNDMYENKTLRTDSITNAVNNNTGLTILNQAAGDLNNQASSASGAANAGSTGVVYSEAQAGAEQASKENTLRESDLTWWTYDPNTIDGDPNNPTRVPGKTATITNAIKNNLGVVHVNQSVGNMNSQANSLALSTSFGDGGVVLTDAVLGQRQYKNTVNEYNVLRQAVLTDAIKNNTGIISVNQSAGSLGNQANVVAIGVAVSIGGGGS